MNAYEKENLAWLRSGLAGCTVLLKKDGSFPLEAPGKIAAFGAGVRHTIKGGTGSGEVNSRFFVNVEQGLKDAGFCVTTASWLDGYDKVYAQAKADFVKEIKRRAKEKKTIAMIEGMGAVMPEPDYSLPLEGEGDTAIYVLSRISGEGNDRQTVAGDFQLTATEQRDILALNEKYEKFMLVLNVGGPVDLTPVMGVRNILVLSQLGVETGTALADILLGKGIPSGKLTTTWAKGENYPDVGNFGDINDTYYKEGIYVGYRWFDAAGKELLFPFGYGLGYTDFAVSEEKVSVEGKTVTITAKVTNTGAHPGRETVQVYVSCPALKLDKPVKDLAGYRKTAMLNPGQSEEVTVAFDLSDCASYDEESAAYILEAGRYIVLAGTSSADVRPAAALALPKTVTVRQVKDMLGKPGFEDWKPAAKTMEYDVPVIALDADAFVTETISYDVTEPVDDIIKGLNTEELCYLNTGSHDPKGGFANVIGSASQNVCGAAGESTSLLKSKGIPAMVMADGPAGLRITPKYYKDKKGKLKSLGSAMPESMLDFMPGILKLFMGGSPKAPKGVEVREQYCTAIPIGTALAQSFDPEYAEICGDVVGGELELFGVHLWLAPALNIHRTALCGRNFEYFSEDPLVSGLVSAAITKGVQRHPGRGVTLKHYAANNQETNRYFSNSHVSQRAMREIYLKGFQIAIRESDPKAVMTSYNLLNGTHTAESRELCTEILRREFGFAGVCMTDWVVAMIPPLAGSIYPNSNPAKVAAAGGDLFMPGSRDDHKKMVEGAGNGVLSKEDLQINGTRVYRMAKALTEAK